MRVALQTTSMDSAPRRKRTRDRSGSYRRDEDEGHSAALRLGDRLREVLERDRALCESAPSFDDLTVREPPALHDVRDHVAAEIAAWIEAELGPRESVEVFAATGAEASAAATYLVEDVRDDEVASVPDEPSGEPASSEPASGEPASSAPSHDLEDDLEAAETHPAVCTEPIRTVTMARLLASQGYAPRALTIYAALLRQTPDDAALASEAAALRARVSGDEAQLSSR